jgi:hypothetical protein
VKLASDAGGQDPSEIISYRLDGIDHVWPAVACPTERVARTIFPEPFVEPRADPRLRGGVDRRVAPGTHIRAARRPRVRGRVERRAATGTHIRHPFASEVTPAVSEA